MPETDKADVWLFFETFNHKLLCINNVFANYTNMQRLYTNPIITIQNI